MKLKIDIHKPIKALVASIAIFVLMLPSINLISPGSLNLNSSIFSSTLLFIDFIIIFIILLIYDKLTMNRLLTYQALLGSFILSILLVSSFMINSTHGLVFNFILMFLVLWLGFLAGRILYDAANRWEKRKILKGIVIFLVLIWLVYLFATLNAGTTGNSISTMINNFIANLKKGTVLSGTLLQSTEVTNCVSQVNQDLNIEQQKAQQGSGVSTSIGITNVTSFDNYYQINPWIVQWASIPSTALFSFQQTSTVNCNQDTSTYVCKDLSILNQSRTNTTTNKIIAVGVVVKISVTQPLYLVSGTSTTNYLLPALCNSSGTLLPNSKYYISH